MTDLSGLISRPAAAGPSQAVAYRQGTVVTFDPITLENTVDVGGTMLTDLPLLGVGESTLLHPGAVVGILAVGDATKTYAILGRLVTPGTPDAADAVSLESSRTKAASVPDIAATTSTDYTGLSPAGPSVTVTVGPSGRLLVSMSAMVSWEILTAGLDGGGWVAPQLSGANTLAADDEQGAIAYSFIGGSTQNFGIISVSRSLVLDGLSTGDTTVSLMYRSNNGQEAQFGFRTVVAQAL